MIKLALINLRHHLVTFGANLLFQLINVWNKYLSTCESVTAERMA